MKKISLILSVTFLSIGLVGCQQSNENEVTNNIENIEKVNEVENNDDKITKQNNITENKTTNENYDIEGVVTEVDSEHNRVLLDLTKKVQENENQMWVEIGENTKISNEIEESLRFGNLKPEDKLKANLAESCLEPDPRICYAEEIVIK